MTQLIPLSDCPHGVFISDAHLADDSDIYDDLNDFDDEDIPHVQAFKAEKMDLHNKLDLYNYVYEASEMELMDEDLINPYDWKKLKVICQEAHDKIKALDIGWYEEAIPRQEVDISEIKAQVLDDRKKEPTR